MLPLQVGNIGGDGVRSRNDMFAGRKEESGDRGNCRGSHDWSGDCDGGGTCHESITCLLINKQEKVWINVYLYEYMEGKVGWLFFYEQTMKKFDEID